RTLAGGLTASFWPVLVAAGDAQGEFFDAGEGVADVAGGVEPGLVAGGLVACQVDGDGPAVALAGPLPVGAVRAGRVGAAPAVRLPAAGAAFDQGAGQGGPGPGQAGERSGEFGQFGAFAVGGSGHAHLLIVPVRGVPLP